MQIRSLSGLTWQDRSGVQVEVGRSQGARGHGEVLTPARWVFAVAIMTTMSACGTQVAPNGTGAVSGPASTRSSNSPSPSTATSVVAGDLAQVRAAGLPDNPQAVTAFLGKLPSVVAGHARTATTLKDTTYADGTQFVAAPLAETSPGLSMRASFEQFVASGQFTITARSSAGDRLLWFVGESTDGRHHPSAAVADADAQWMLGIDAVSHEALADLARALRTNSASS